MALNMFLTASHFLDPVPPETKSHSCFFFFPPQSAMSIPGLHFGLRFPKGVSILYS